MNPEEIRVIGCAPVTLPPELAGVIEWKPSIEHSLTSCELCLQQVWIGPAQRRHRAAEQAQVQCWLCIAEQVNDADDVRFVGLNPDIDKVPKRR